MTEVGNKPVGNVNIESEGEKVEKEGNIAKLNEISKEVDEGHQDLRRSKRQESIVQDQNDEVTVVKEENVPRQLRTRESSSSKEEKGNTT